jgi:hypothetical protein
MIHEVSDVLLWAFVALILYNQYKQTKFNQHALSALDHIIKAGRSTIETIDLLRKLIRLK